MFKKLSFSRKPLAETRRKAITPSEFFSDSVNRYLSTPLPDLNKPLEEHHFIALDFETTGLNFERDNILSLGCVRLTTESIDFSSSLEIYINNGHLINAQSAKINGITKQIADKGVELSHAFDHLLEEMRGKIVLAHNASIEKAFINNYAKQVYQLDDFPCYFLDTLALEKRFSFSARAKQHTSYQLNDLRRHYNLPDYIEHSAASDAAACAELFMVQYKKFKLNNGKPIKKLVSHY